MPEGWGEFALAHQQHSRLIRVKSAQVALPEAKRCWTATAVLWQPARVRQSNCLGASGRPWLACPKASTPHGNSTSTKNHSPKHRLICGTKKPTPSTCLFSSNRHLWANTAQCSPGARTCLGGLILLPLALVSVVGSLGFSGIGHYLPYCESRSNTEKVFTFPPGLFLGHCLAARQNYQSLLPKALFLGLEILRCWRSGGLRYIGRTLISPACIILGAGQCYQSLAKKE